MPFLGPVGLGPTILDDLSNALTAYAMTSCLLIYFTHISRGENSTGPQFILTGLQWSCAYGLKSTFTIACLVSIAKSILASSPLHHEEY